MNNQTNNPVENPEIEIDLMHLLKVLWQRKWIILICTILIGAIALGYAYFFVKPEYQAKAMMYVNNSTVSIGGTSVSISPSELSAAKSLLNIYLIILQSRTTLDQVIQDSGLNYTYAQMSKMVKASSVNSTEVFQIVATCNNPGDAKLIVDTIVKILPDRVADIVDGSSVRLVDHAVYPTSRSAPSYSRYLMIGLLIGFVLSCALFILIDLLDTTIRDEDYLFQRYNIPVLAVVPDATETGKSSYGYGHYYGQSGSSR